jgi:CO/xanthine dehydrogenase FAD-binding subunit
MVKEYYRPTSIGEALDLLAVPGTLAIAGGTAALAFEARDKPERIVDVGKLLPKAILLREEELIIGACATFQEMIEFGQMPAVIAAAARSMANRNTRNRATVGGNLGANKSCSSLAPIFLVLGASVEYQERGGPAATTPLADWLDSPRGLILNVRVRMATGLYTSSLRASRTACDIATATAACAYRLEGGTVRDLRIAVGGFAAHAQLRPDIARLFEGLALPPKAAIDKAVDPLLKAIADQRGSADYKRLRGAALVADAMHAAEEMS